VESLTPDEARGHGFTTIVTYLPSTPYDAGTGAVRIWMPNFLSLATYLGYQDLSGTQRYLHLTAELFPEITARADAAFGDVIPRREP
jgi:hypothetical protein